MDKKDIVIDQLQDLKDKTADKSNELYCEGTGISWKEYDYVADVLDKVALIKCGPCKGKQAFMK